MVTKPVAKSLASRRPSTADEAHIVIVGAGLAGLYAALKLAPLPVTVVAAAPLGQGASSVWAQGGVAAAVGEGDTPEAHAADTVAAGAGIVDPTVALTIASEARARIMDLAELGVPFDRSGADGFVLSREAAHSMNRVVRVAGDRAGAAIMATLVEKARNAPSIRLLEGYTAFELTSRRGNITGVDVIATAQSAVPPPATGHAATLHIPATQVLLATGGAGGLYAVTTNPPIARGEGFAIAARAGALIADAEFVQFHPTAIDVGLDPAPLASEALRGEGAVLVNRDGRPFMPGYDARADLAPRDVVARAVFAERASGRGAYLDARTAIGDRFAALFPTVNAACVKAGINPASDLIPVAPAAHYHMGGIATDLNGRTTVNGLWAIGEAGCTGLHGANRLASNSLLEAVVVGARAAADVTKSLATRGVVWSTPQPRPAPALLPHEDAAALLAELRTMMSADVGVVRDAAGLARAVAKLRALSAYAVTRDVPLANAVMAAGFIANAAARRLESRGGHFRSDYPGADPGTPHRSFLKMTVDGMYVTVETSVSSGIEVQTDAPFSASTTRAVA